MRELFRYIGSTESMPDPVEVLSVLSSRVTAAMYGAQAMTSGAEDVTHMNCVECSMALPIRISQESRAQQVRCRFCGSVYRGVLLPDASEQLNENIEVLEGDPHYRMRSPQPTDRPQQRSD